MDAYLELFNTDKLYERRYLRGGQTDGRVEPVDIDSDSDSMDCQAGPSENGLQYVSEYQLEEERAMLQQGAAAEEEEEEEDMLIESPQRIRLGYLENITQGTAGPCEDLLDTEHLTAVYNNYEFDCIPQNLPIVAYKSKIVDMVNTYSTVILEGHTGCGKTTQVPQYILDEARKNGTYCNIVVTQPRRIAAISIAKRVADERKWKLGSLVGYKIGLKDCTSEDTRLLYCTTGVLLQTLIGERSLQRYTHIILDEVHERNKDMDFLLLIVRKLQRTISRNVKVVLMSATLNSVRFGQYFSMNIAGNLCNAPILALESSKKHNLSIYYLGELKELGVEIKQRKEDAPEPIVTHNHHQLVLTLIKTFDKLEVEGQLRGTVLVFLPGILEIDYLLRTLLPEADRMRWQVLRLHSSITQIEQSRVFVEPAPGMRKIIAATNIAESSITVPDIKYVIDYCMMKELVADPYTNFTSLCLVWASKANCTQRAGRTGRIGPGRVYRLLHKSEFEQLLDEQIPEMKRSPLDHLVLKSKQLSSDKPKALLALALDPPELKNIESTILQLKEAGGLLMTAKGEYCSDDGDITYLGTIMAELPLDIHVSKMVALGHIFGVLEDCIIMGASMSVKNMFARPYKKDLEAYMSKLAWSSCSSSDPIAFLKAYTTWKKKHEGGDFRQEGSEAKWVRRYFLESRCLREIKDLVEDLQKRLMRLGISDKRQPNDVIWSEDEEPLVLKLVLAGAFYPNYFVRGSLGGQVNEEDAVKLLVGRDPYSSVYLLGMPQNHPGELYTKNIKQMLQDLGSNNRVTFDDTKKVYVEFPKVEVPKPTDGNPVARAPGQVSLMVYKAIKLGKISKFELRVLPEWKVKNHTERLRKPPLLALAELGSERSRQIYQQHDLRERWRSDVRPGIACVSPAPSSVASSSSTHIHTKLPGLNITHLRLKSPFLETPGRFWVNIVEDESGMQQMHNCLNANPAELVPLEPRQLYVGQMVVAPYLDTQWLMYRARIVRLPSADNNNEARVYFVDFGNHESIPVEDLKGFSARQRNLGAHTQPDFALECRLAMVQASQIKGCGQWSADAIKVFRDHVLETIFYARVYSVVNSVVSLIVYLKPKLDEKDMMANSLNAELIRMRLAQSAQDSHLSQDNHKTRDNVAKNLLTEDQIAVYEELQCSTLGLEVTSDPQPPPPCDTTNTVKLTGPYSPLEMKVYQMVKGGSNTKEVSIDPNSVNSVLIDDEPQDKFDRLIVAASVHNSQDGNRLTLRQTTIMPNLPGLPALVCLLFAPRVELRVDRDKEKITGGLFGLGCKPSDPRHRPLFPAHDMELPFDTVFSMNDILQVNKLRFWMNSAWLKLNGEEYPDSSTAQVFMYQKKVKNFLQWLLARERNYKDPVLSARSHKWGLLSSELRFPMCKEEAEQQVFPMHWGVKLLPPGTSVKKRLEENLKELKSMCCRAEENVDDKRCDLCKEMVQSLHQLKSHLQSSDHLLAEAQLYGEDFLIPELTDDD